MEKVKELENIKKELDKKMISSYIRDEMLNIEMTNLMIDITIESEEIKDYRLYELVFTEQSKTNMSWNELYRCETNKELISYTKNLYRQLEKAMNNL